MDSSKRDSSDSIDSTDQIEDKATTSGIPPHALAGLDESKEEVRSVCPGLHGRRKSSARSDSVPSIRYDRRKSENLFPPTKKYHYYPVTCDYCGNRFQPNELKDHQQKHHFNESEKQVKFKSKQSAPTGKITQRPGPSDDGRRKSMGGMPRRLQICYICGRMYGSKSLPIHEPKCLEKWRIQNDLLPPELRAPEPVKQEPLLPDSRPVSEDKRYSLPAFDPAAEAAFRSHLATLIPCTYCSRTFSPDRIQTHMGCCIERPKTRQLATPVDGIPR